MKNPLRNSLLTIGWIFIGSISLLAQKSTNSELIGAIENVLASNSPVTVKSLSAKKLIRQLDTQYKSEIEAGTDSRLVKDTNIESYQVIIADFNNQLAALSGGNSAPKPEKMTENKFTENQNPSSQIATRFDENSAPSSVKKTSAAEKLQSKNASEKDKAEDDPTPTPATFTEIPVAGGTQIRGHGKAGSKYEINVDGEDKGSAMALADGSFNHSIPELKAGSKVIIAPVDDDGNPVLGQGVSEEVVNYSDPTKGGIFGVLIGGAVFSQQNQNYGQTSPFFGFSAGYGSKVFRVNRYVGTISGSNKTAYLTLTSSPNFLVDSDGKTWKRDYSLGKGELKYTNGNEILVVEDPKTGKGFARLKKESSLKTFRLNFRFQGIFESDGRAATGDKTDLAASDPNNLFNFIASQQTFTTQAEAWAELRPLNQFSFGPYVSFGTSALVDKNNAMAGTKLVTDEGENATVQKLDTDLKKFWEFGTLFNLRFPDQKFFLQSILAYGNYEQYRGLDDRPDMLAATTSFNSNDTRHRFVGKLRVFPEGLNTTFGRQVTLTPMFGVDLNAGTGPDNLRFFTGFAIRLKGIKTAEAETSK